MTTTQKGLKIYVPTELADRVQARAEAEGRTMAGLVRMLPRGWLAEGEKRDERA